MENKQYTLDELKDKLTEKEKIFCHEYIIDWNGARAARVAGYSEKTAKQIAHDNLTKLYLNQYIDFIKDDYEKEAGITKLSQINGFLEIINDENASNRDRISARTELNKMLGYNAPEKTEQKITLHDKIKKVDKIDFTE